MIDYVFSAVVKKKYEGFAKSDEDILELAHPLWADLVKYSNEQNYGAFTRNFSTAMKMGANEIEMGKQFARSDLAKNLSADYEIQSNLSLSLAVNNLFNEYYLPARSQWAAPLRSFTSISQAL